MANTTNGIYYPNDYNAAADVLADMKKMAESIDDKFGDVENNGVEIKQDILNIKDEQATQNTKITDLENNIATNINDIKTIQDEQATQDTKITDLENNIATNINDIKTIQDEQATQNTKMADLENNITTNTNEIKTIQDEQITQNDRIDALEEKNDRHYDYIEDLQLRTTELEIQAAVLEKENAELKETVNSMQIPGEEEGNSIHLTDSSDLDCEIVPIGNAEQEKREGYNKLNSDALVGKTVSEVANNDSALAIHMTEWDLQADTEYAFVLEITDSQIDTNFLLSFKDSANATVKNIYSQDGGRIFTMTADELNNSSYCYLYWNKSGDFGTKIINNLMIVESANITKPYEAYGASPTPKNPSKVVTVGQNVQLFDKDNTNTIKAIINGTTKEITAFDTCRSIYIPCNKNEDYAVSRVVGTRFVVGTTTDVPTAGSVCNQIVANNTASSITIKTGENDNYLAVFYYNSGTDTLTEQEIIDSIKISKGTSTGGYSTYGQGSVEIDVVNKNWYDKKNITLWNDNNSAFDTIGNGTSTRVRTNSFKIIGGKTYVLSGLTGKVMLSNVRGYNEEKVYASSLASVNGNVITLKENTKYIHLLFKNSDNSDLSKDDIANMDLQLELGLVETDFTPHESQKVSLPIQKEFVKLGDIEDTFIKQDGKWYEAHIFKKMVLDGTDNSFLAKHGSIATETNGFYSIRLNGRMLVSGSSGSINFAKCNYLEYINNSSAQNAVYTTGIWWEGNTEYNYASIPFLTLEEANNWLTELNNSGNPFIIYYPSETPELIPCTEEQEQILNSFHTYKNITNISVDGIGTVKVNYKKDLETLFNNINSAIVGGN